LPFVSVPRFAVSRRMMVKLASQRIGANVGGGRVDVQRDAAPLAYWRRV